MTSPLPQARLSRFGMLALAAVAAFALLLAFSAGAFAAKRACASSSHRSARACAQSHRRHRTSRARHSRRHHHSKAPAAGTPTSGSVKAVPPVCEDGTNAVRSSGAPTCDDNSEPFCTDGTSPVLSSSGRLMFCRPESEGKLPPSETCTAAEQASGECTSARDATSACDDGSEAALDLQGAYVCGDGSEPRCPEPAALTLAESGAALVCEPVEESD